VSLNPGTATLAVDDNPRRYEHLSTIRLEDPAAVARAAKARRRHPGLKHGRQNFIVAADHPARGALSVGTTRWPWRTAASSWTVCRLRWPTRQWTAFWRPRTSWTTCCSWAPWRASSSSGR
jgi:hypothetical protein